MASPRPLRRPPAPDGPPIARAALNRALLARQALLARAPSTPEGMVERLVGLQAQVPHDPYLSLWSRVEDFEADALERLLLERRVVRMTLMRTTLHLVTARDAVALRTALQPVCERAFAGSLFRRRLSGADVSAIVRAGAELLDAAPLTIVELGRALQRHWPEYDADALGLAVRYRVPLVQVPPRGLLSQSAPARMTTLRAWLGPESGTISDDPTERAIAEESTVLRYLTAFGPSTSADIRAWSWLPGVAGILDRLGDRVRWWRDDRGRRLADAVDGELAPGDAPVPVRFLGEYDNVFLAHADRTRVTGDIAWGSDYVRRGAFFVGGFLAGPWQLTTVARRSALTLEARVPIGPSQRGDVEAEGRRLVTWLVPDVGPDVEVRWLQS